MMMQMGRFGGLKDVEVEFDGVVDTGEFDDVGENEFNGMDEGKSLGDEKNVSQHCKLGDQDDCDRLLESVMKAEENGKLDDSLVEELGEVGMMVQELGRENLPPNLLQLLEHENFTTDLLHPSLLQMLDQGNSTSVDLIMLSNNLSILNSAELFGNFQVHLGPISVGEKGLSVKPQMKFGAESDHFQFVAGCDDLSSGVKCHATAEVRQSCTASGSSLTDFLRKTRCHGSEVVPGAKLTEVSAQLLAMLTDELGINGQGSFTVKGKITIAQGAAVMAGVALGLWEDSEGYRMIGGGVAGLKKEIGGEFYVGIHKHGRMAKFKVALGPGTVEGTFDCMSKKVDAAKANRIQSQTPLTSAPAKKFSPIGFGYGRGPGGAKTSGYCKMYVTWNDCMLECDRQAACIGFDAEEVYNRHWQQCCIRTKHLVHKSGWQSGHGPSTSLTQGTHKSPNNRLVMSKNQFVHIGGGYGRGPGGEKTCAYCKMQVTHNNCRKQCENDDSCTGFDVEYHHVGYWQQCCIRTMKGTGAPHGWTYGAHPFCGKYLSFPIGSATHGKSSNRRVYKKVVR